MILQCIIISLAFVEVIALSLVEYQKSVHLTNLYMLEAQNHDKTSLMEIIRDIIYENQPIDRMAMLLVVLEFTYDQNLRDVIDTHQVALRTAISQTFRPQNSEDDADQGPQNSEDDADQGPQISEDDANQGPQISEDDANQVYDLSDLGRARRFITANVIKTIIQQTIVELLQNAAILEKNICRAVALLINAGNTTSYITSAEVDGFGICIIINSKTETTYVNVTDVNELRKLLSHW